MNSSIASAVRRVTRSIPRAAAHATALSDTRSRPRLPLPTMRRLGARSAIHSKSSGRRRCPSRRTHGQRTSSPHSMRSREKSFPSTFTWPNRYALKRATPAFYQAQAGHNAVELHAPLVFPLRLRPAPCGGMVRDLDPQEGFRYRETRLRRRFHALLTAEQTTRHFPHGARVLFPLYRRLRTQTERRRPAGRRGSGARRIPTMTFLHAGGWAT